MSLELAGDIAVRLIPALNCGMELTETLKRQGETLAAVMSRKGFNQTRLAKATGISQSAISAMISGRQRPFFDQVASIARVLGVPLDDLATGRITPEPDPDESAILQMVRDLGLSRAAATRGLAIAASQAEPVQRRIVVGPERDETAHDDTLERARNRPVKVEPKPTKDPQSKR